MGEICLGLLKVYDPLQRHIKEQQDINRISKCIITIKPNASEYD